MSTIKTNAVQIGQSPTATNNFTFYQPAVPDGSVRIGNGNAGAATDKITIDSSGNVSPGVTNTQTLGIVGDVWSNVYATTFTGTTGTFSGNVQMASQNGGQLAGLRNKIINGDMRVAQRGIVSSGISTVTYTLDRWIVFTGGASLSVGQSAGDGASFQYALNVVGAAGNTSCNMTQRIEQRNAYPLASKQITVSARIYASASFTPTWSVDSANTADTFSATTIVANGTFSALAIGWNDVTFTTTLNSACQNGFQVSFLMGATTSGNKGLTGVQLEVGPVATPFEQRPYGMELALCQRYFGGVLPHYRRNDDAFSNGTDGGMVHYPVTPRATPVVTLTLGGANVTALASAGTSTAMAYFNYTWTTATVTARDAIVQGTYTAEL